MVAIELEVLAKKFDRFGWQRDQGTAAHDRLIIDWMDALQDFPLDEVRTACRACVIAEPSKMPNEGHVRSKIMEARALQFAMRPRLQPAPMRPPEPELPRMTAERAAEIMAEVGFRPRRFIDEA